MQTVRLYAYAKINIGLRVTGKRPDGYHEIETIFQQISLPDKVRITLAPAVSPAIRIICNRPGIPVDARNLAYGAAERYLQRSGHCVAVEIGLEKNIPVGAGLGGGSSDAAAVLLALDRLLASPLPFTELEEIAASLGADVPFFLTGGTAYATGIGEVLTPLKIRLDRYIVVVHPPVSISTKWAYTNLKIRLTNTKNNLKLTHFFTSENGVESWRKTISNDFEPLVFGNYRELENIKLQLYEVGAKYASLTGSGSALYGIFTSKEDAINGVDLFRPHYSTFLTTPIRPGIQAIKEREG